MNDYIEQWEMIATLLKSSKALAALAREYWLNEQLAESLEAVTHVDNYSAWAAHIANMTQREYSVWYNDNFGTAVTPRDTNVSAVPVQMALL